MILMDPFQMRIFHDSKITLPSKNNITSCCLSHIVPRAESLPKHPHTFARALLNSSWTEHCPGLLKPCRAQPNPLLLGHEQPSPAPPPSATEWQQSSVHTGNWDNAPWTHSSTAELGATPKRPRQVQCSSVSCFMTQLQDLPPALHKWHLPGWRDPRSPLQQSKQIPPWCLSQELTLLKTEFTSLC